jgi:hypothetical protein
MGERVLRHETPVEFFREQLEKAMDHQRVSTSAFTEFYLVNLLAACVQGDSLPKPDAGYDETPLALLYVRALNSTRLERARLLRATGDLALFVSGFFGDSLTRRISDLSYYRAMGGQAYGRLSEESGGPFGFGPEVFAELARRFTQFADLLAEVSESSGIQSDTSTLRLYERWAQTGSRRAAAALQARGIVPMNPGEGPVQ